MLQSNYFIVELIFYHMNYLFKRPLLLYILVIFSLCSSCDIFFASKKHQHKYAMISFSKSNQTFYQYKHPDYEKDLGVELTEISGLDFDELNNSLLAINDEEGNVYELNIKNFDIISKNQFWNTGDYEAIEFDGIYIWILKSNGKLYKYDPIKKETEVIETKLSSDNDVEGLCFNHDEGVFYIACKGNTLNKEDKVKTKAIYVFDIVKNKLRKNPLFKIHPKQLKKFMLENADGKVDSNFLDRADVFSPSAIAMSENKDLFILSARGSALLVIDSDLNIKELTFFNPKYLPQPEGICFDGENNLYVSTEGKSQKARLVVYKRGY